MDPALLDLLCCPETHQPLRVAAPEELARIGAEAALVRADNLAAYPICDGIPLLVPEERITLAPDQPASAG